jgi:hypothetical protein
VQTPDFGREPWRRQDSSSVTFSPVTVLTTLGPVTNSSLCLCHFVKSVRQVNTLRHRHRDRDCGNLRYTPDAIYSLKNFSITAKHFFTPYPENARRAVVYADNGAAPIFKAFIHYLTYFFARTFRKRTANTVKSVRKGRLIFHR